MTNVIGKTVRENVLRLIADRDEGNQSAAVRRCKISQTTLNGICRGRADATLASIELIAVGYELEPWMLLIENLDTSNPPVVCPTTPAEREFHARMKAAFDAISNNS